MIWFSNSLPEQIIFKNRGLTVLENNFKKQVQFSFELFTDFYLKQKKIFKNPCFFSKVNHSSNSVFILQTVKIFI